MDRAKELDPRRALLAVLLIGATVLVPFALSATGHLGPARELAGRYRMVTDADGMLLFCTGLPVTVGDQFIGHSNEIYSITRVERERATAVPVMVERNVPDLEQQLVVIEDPPLGRAAMPLGVLSRTVVIYHTHTDESYEPTDGRPFITARGGVVAVGDSLRRALEGVGYIVVHDQTPHHPHDALAYARSRRTATSNLKHKPYLMFDIHRDSGPAETYVVRVEGEPASQVLLVVGRQNPLLTANLSLARKIKSVADAAYPALVKGIFLAMGDYNQDLDPGALLLEVGTEKVPREMCERSMGFFARVIARAFGAPGV
ncbi:MAG: stage II sporulation protein P [Firmicutes bacterium]|jgi:stage II sporulation protein P|nr:stage II sporulation protein P [Bacillota bacterium]